MTKFLAGNFYFTEYINNKCAIGHVSNSNPTALVQGVSYPQHLNIPSNIKKNDGTEFVVIAIENFSFCYHSDFSSVTIPSTIQYIGRDSFYGTSILNIVIPNSVITFVLGSLSTMKSCTNIAFEQNSQIQILTKHWMCWSNVKEIVIPPSVVVVETEAFAYCKVLEKIYFCSSKDISSIANLFYQSNQNVVVYVSSSYPKGSTFGGIVPLYTGISYCKNYNQKSCACQGCKSSMNVLLLMNIVLIS